MKEEPIKTYKKNRAYNMQVIMAIWKKVKGSCGKNKIRGNEFDRNSLFASIETSKETIRQIILMEAGYNVKKINEWAKRIENKTGIPHEYLDGKEHIQLGKEFEQKFYNNYDDYLEGFDSINDALTKEKITEIKPSKSDMQKLINQKRDETTRKETDKALDKVKELHAFITDFDIELKQEIDKLIKSTMDNDFNGDIKLYRLLYYIKKGVKFSTATTEQILEIEKVISDIKTWQLKGLGEKELKKYIAVLKKQLELAEAVYIVAVDCGNF